MADLAPDQYAYILDDAIASDAAARLSHTAYTATSSDTSIVTIAAGDGDPTTLVIVGQAEGTATITVTRLSDHAVATRDAVVEAAAGGSGFAVRFGAPIDNP